MIVLQEQGSCTVAKLLRQIHGAKLVHPKTPWPSQNHIEENLNGKLYHLRAMVQYSCGFSSHTIQAFNWSLWERLEETQRMFYIPNDFDYV